MIHGIHEATTQANTPDPDGEFFHILLHDNSEYEPKHIFSTGVVKLADEILDNTESDIHWVRGNVQYLLHNIYVEFSSRSVGCLSVIFSLLGME
jgi:hypothetical protein